MPFRLGDYFDLHALSDEQGICYANGGEISKFKFYLHFLDNFVGESDLANSLVKLNGKLVY